MGEHRRTIISHVNPTYFIGSMVVIHDFSYDPRRQVLTNIFPGQAEGLELIVLQRLCLAFLFELS